MLKRLFFLPKFVVNEYIRQGKSADDILSHYELKYKDKDLAREEFVAESMEPILVRAFEGDTKPLNRLKNSKCHDVWLKIREMLTRIARTIVNEYKGLRPDSEAGRFVAQLSDDTFNVLKDMYFDAMSKAAESRQYFRGLDELVAFLDEHNISREGTDLEHYKTKNTANNDGVRYDIRKEFPAELQEWFDTTTHEERKMSGKRFLVGSTTDVLKSIGVKECNIYFGGSKINKILSDNESMTLEIIKEAVTLIEDPILILKSATVEDSIVLFGEVYTASNKPVMISMLYNPKTKSGDILDYAVVTSAYGRRVSNLQNLINTSTIYYICENKKRTDKWLKALGLQLPSALTKYGSINIIPDSTEKSNTKIKKSDRDTAYLEAVESGDIRYSQRDFKNALSSAEWKKYNYAMISKVDAGLRVSDHSMLVECEDGEYSYKLIVYDKDTEENDILAIYGIGENLYNEDISSFDQKIIGETITELEDRKYDNKKVLKKLLRNHSEVFGYVFGRYNIKSKRYDEIRGSASKNRANHKNKSNRAGVSTDAQQGVPDRLVVSDILSVEIPLCRA